MLSYFKRFFDMYVAPQNIFQPTLHPSGTLVTPINPTPSPVTVGVVGVVPTTPTPTMPPTVSSPISTGRARQVGPNIAIVNVSSVVTNEEVAAFTAAMQIQLDRDFAPAWQLTANLTTFPSGAAIPSGSWILYIMDTSDQAGALGYHDLTSDGYPIGKVFAKDDQKYGLSWTVTASHEIVEMLADPYIQNTVFAQTSNTGGTLYSLEVADAVEDDSFGYKINNVLLSDFVYPAWFEDFRAPNSTQFDHMNVVKAPLQLAKGGYIGVFAIPNTGGWTQRLADTVPTRLRLRGEYARANRRGAVPLTT